MKSRSHRLPASEPHPHHDDWVDGSWTVDCVCGVNFDDGDEMVNCDECGVWVHTRCSRYVKSEKSFACDKCKNKKSGNGGGGGVRNDSEETEVAEFLVELPTKTLRMENPNPASVPSSRPFRLWTDIPMEERVHVQGVPGGEPGLFSGIKMSKVFGPELWKSTGYVPKKFDFSYSEFPCLGHDKVEEKREEEMDKANGEENANQADNGAGVLFSLSKENENSLLTPTVDSVGAKSPVECGGCHELVSPRYKKKLDGEDLDFTCPENCIKESSSVPVVLHSGKRKKEELGTSKVQNVKKKMRAIEKEGDFRKRTAHDSKAASTFSSDATPLEFSQGRSFKTGSDDIQCGKDFLGDQLSDDLGECATNLASNEHGLEVTLRNDVSSDGISRKGSRGDQVPVGSENFFKTNIGGESLAENGSRSTPVKEEVPGDTLQSCEDVEGGIESVEVGSHHKGPMAVDVRVAGLDAKESQRGQDSDIDEANSRPNKKLKGEVNFDDHGRQYVDSLPLNDVKLDTMKTTTQHPESCVNVFPEESKVIETSVIGSEASDAMVLDASRGLTVGCSRTDKSDESPCNPYQTKREPTGSEGSMGPRKRSSALKHSAEVAGELLKHNGSARSHSTASYQRKAVASVVKSPSTSGSVMSKSSENRVAATAQNSSIQSRQRELSESSVGTMKDNASADTVENDEKFGRPKKLVKESSRLNSLSKTSEPTKLSHASDSKRLSSDSKDPGTHSSSKVPLVPNVASNLVPGECASPPSFEGASNMEKKAAASVVSGKGEKFCQLVGQPSSRGNVASLTAPASSNVPAILSDEELALLLHQELNSSPRVPRVPRMRHAGSLPQLTCSSATSMLMKRTSSGGAKDHGLTSRKRTKDFSGEGLHGSLEVDNEAKKTEKKPSSPENRRRDSGCSIDPLSRAEADGGPVKSVQSMKKIVISSLSSSNDANGQNLSSSRPSSRNASDDDPRMVGRQLNRTLPGLIAEIMSEGKRMTYEELCNAVLPHWPHLRKHNGERYAYSSHSQAVLDCLRNRSEWARLVDRGPKTSASRKRRKLDADSMSIESEDNEENRAKNLKDVGSKSFESHQEDFPKGKRKARKRRRLALQGRGIVRRRRRADVVSDDESESFSNSSEDSMSSEEEIQGGGTSIVGSEASASSDEVR